MLPRFNCPQWGTARTGEAAALLAGRRALRERIAVSVVGLRTLRIASRILELCGTTDTFTPYCAPRLRKAVSHGRRSRNTVHAAPGSSLSLSHADERITSSARVSVDLSCKSSMTTLFAAKNGKRFRPPHAFMNCV